MKVVALLVVLFLFRGTPDAFAVRGACPGEVVVVAAAAADEYESVCAAVRSCTPFLKSLGLVLPDGLTLTLEGAPLEKSLDHAFGYYDPRSNSIHLLNYRAALEASRAAPSFGVPFDPAIWRSYIIHELAHAAAQGGFRRGAQSHTASEYIAAVSQLATLAPDERARILEHYGELSGFDGVEDITLNYYLLDPARFAINSFLHYLKPGNGAAFVRQLLLNGLPDE
ncbi:DUF6639 family protein [Geomonas ferrireducens]|uniref:DUF6639 family protein n=1 Tax=Geomonas ferrireducens TaxID=2570227 RepID=UPI0010A8EFF1|nr:DUF6639 family protein [Geomonas ferrireducens]